MSEKMIVKKSSELEAYSEKKLRKSIINAFKAVNMGYSKVLIDNILSQLTIEDNISSNEIRNQLEVILMNSGFYNVAKAFIAYEQKKLIQDRDVTDRIDFIKKYCESINSASGSQFDANANVDNKNIATLNGEIPKGLFIKINRKLLHNKIKALYGKKTADKYIRLLKEHHLYKNDETSTNNYTYSGEDKFYIYHKEENDYTEVRFDEFYNNLAVNEHLVDRENEVYQKFTDKLYVKDRNGYVKVLALTKKKRHRDMYKVTLFDGKSIIVTDNHPLIIRDNKNDTVDANKINNSYAQFVISERKWVEIKESVKIDSNEEWIYDITTESETLVVNDIWCHNCASITMYPWLLNGTKDIGGNSTAPTNLKSFCGGLINMVFMVSSMLAGACLYKNQKLIIENDNKNFVYTANNFVNKFKLNKSFENYQGEWTYKDISDQNFYIKDGNSKIKITKVYKRKYKDLIYKLKTHTGLELFCTKDHRIKTLYKGRTIDLKAEELMYHDTIYVDPDMSILINKQSDDYRFGQLLGLICGDGSVTTKNTIRLSVNYEQEAIGDRFISLMKQFYNIDIHKENGHNCYDYRIYNTEVYKKFIKNFCGKSLYTEDKNVSMKDKSLDFKLGFLDGLLVTDGCFGGKNLSISIINLNLINTIIEILKDININDIKYTHIPAHDNKKDLYRLNVPLKTIKYLDLTPQFPRKSAKLVTAVDPTREIYYYSKDAFKNSTFHSKDTVKRITDSNQKIDYNTDVIESIDTFENDDEYVYEIETESHYYEAGGIIQHNCSTPEMFNYMNYFLEQEYGEDYYKDVNKVVDLSKKQRTLDKVITDCFEQIVYSLNQPTGARNFQCVRETTELWTPEGFKKLSELKEGDKCYVWKDEKFEVETINKINIHDFDGELIQFIGDTYQQTVTPNHRVLHKLKDCYGITEAENIVNMFNKGTPFELPLQNGNMVTLKEIKYVKYTGKVWCPTTNAGIVVFREENNVPYISGNSVFWNVAYYDKYYFNSLFENFVFPDGTKPHWEGVSWLQKRFMKWFNKERTKTVLTFPVETMAMLYEVDENGKVHFKDKEYEDFTAEMYSKGHSFFTYLSDRADSLSSCCFSGDQEVMFKNDKSGIEIRSFKNAYDKWNDNYLVYHNGEWKKAKAIRLPARKMYEILTDFGQTIIVSDNHLNPTIRGDIRTDELTVNDYLRVEDDLSFINIQEFSNENDVNEVRRKKTYKFYEKDGLKYVKIKSVTSIDYNDEYIYCFEMEDQSDPYFTLPNGIITHNCRLRNELTDNTFSYTLGAGGVSSGSKSVLTINVNRVVQWAIKNNMDYKEYFNEVVDLCHKVQTAYNENLKDLQNAGMLPLFDAGYIAINRQYLTIGINGIVEAAEFLGIEITDNPKYAEFVEGVLSIVENLNKQYRTKELMFNCEMIPAENVGVKHAKWDKEDGYVVPRDCYNSYFYKVEDKTLTIIDKIKLHGKKYIQHLTGGSALHLNLEEHLSKEQYKKVIEIAAKEGCNYLTFNIPNTLCNNCGYIDKRYLKECPKCHSKNVDYLTRIIGYLKRISNFSEGRQIEASKRNYHNANKEKTDIANC